MRWYDEHHLDLDLENKKELSKTTFNLEYDVLSKKWEYKFTKITKK